MTNPTSTALATQETGPSAMVQQYRDDYAMVLPSHIKPDTWVRLAIGALRRDPKLTQAATDDPASLMQALLDAARKGLEPGTEQYYLTPRMAKGKWTVLGIEGYQGIIERIYRAGAVSSVIVEVVREADRFAYAPGRDKRPQHDVDWFADDRGPLVGVYAFAVMRDGATSKVVVLNRTQIGEAKANSQGSSSQYSPWQTSEEAMWLKTAARRLSKWVPTSAEYLREQLRAVQDVAAERIATSAAALPQPLTPDTDDIETVDGELVDTTTGEVLT